MTRQRRGAVAPPQELESWELFASLHGYFGPPGTHTYDDSKLAEWIAARQRWEAEHGPFPDGESTVAHREPSDELRDFRLRCARRGVLFDLNSSVNTREEFAKRTALYEEWLAEREAFSCEYGWRGGRAVRRSEESYGLFDPNEI